MPLRNEGDILPLDKDRLARLVVIGDNAIARHASGGHSSGVKALDEVTPLEGLQDRLEAASASIFSGLSDPERRLLVH